MTLEDSHFVVSTLSNRGSIELLTRSLSMISESLGPLPFSLIKTALTSFKRLSDYPLLGGLLESLASQRNHCGNDIVSSMAQGEENFAEDDLVDSLVQSICVMHEKVRIMPLFYIP